MFDYWRVNNAEMGIEWGTMSKMRFWFWRTGSLIVRNGESQHFFGFEYGFFLFRNGTINSHWGILIPNLMMTDDLNRMIASTNQIQPSVLVHFLQSAMDISGFVQSTVLFAKIPIGSYSLTESADSQLKWMGIWLSLSLHECRVCPWGRCRARRHRFFGSFFFDAKRHRNTCLFLSHGFIMFHYVLN